MFSRSDPIGTVPSSLLCDIGCLCLFFYYYYANLLLSLLLLVSTIVSRDLQTMGGADMATLPTSSSNCISLLIFDAGNFVSNRFFLRALTCNSVAAEVDLGPLALEGKGEGTRADVSEEESGKGAAGAAVAASEPEPEASFNFETFVEFEFAEASAGFSIRGSNFKTSEPLPPASSSLLSTFDFSSIFLEFL